MIKEWLKNSKHLIDVYKNMDKKRRISFNLFGSGIFVICQMSLTMFVNIITASIWAFPFTFIILAMMFKDEDV